MSILYRSFAALVLLAISASAQTIEVTSTGVGIGTSSPGRKLDVNGDANIGTNLVVNTGVYYGASYSLGSGYYLRNSTGGELMRVTESGSVGVGTTAPEYAFHVVGQAKFGLNNTSINNYGGILVASGTGVGGARQYWIGASNPTSHNNNNFVISDYNGSTNSPLLTIYGTHNGSSSGYVGIGTTTPTAPLTVDTTAFMCGYITSNAGSGTRVDLENQSSGIRYQIQIG